MGIKTALVCLPWLFKDSRMYMKQLIWCLACSKGTISLSYVNFKVSPKPCCGDFLAPPLMHLGIVVTACCNGKPSFLL